MRKSMMGFLVLSLLCGCVLPVLSEGTTLHLTQARLDAYYAMPTCTGEIEVYLGFASAPDLHVDRQGQPVEARAFCEKDHGNSSYVETWGNDAEVVIDGLFLMNQQGQVMLDASGISGAERIASVWGESNDSLLAVLTQGTDEEEFAALVDGSGRMLVPFGRYNAFRGMGGDRIMVYRDNAGYGLIDVEGNEIVEPQYGGMLLKEYHDAEGAAHALVLAAKSIWGEPESERFPDFIDLIYFPDIYLFARTRGCFPTDEERDNWSSVLGQLRAEAKGEEECEDEDLYLPFSKEGLPGNPMLTEDGRKWYLWYDEGPVGTAWGVLDADGNQLIDFVGEHEPSFAIFHEALEEVYGAICMPVNGQWRVWEIR